VATYLTTTGKQFLAVMLDCGGAGNLSCNPYWMNFSTCAAGAAAGDTGIGATNWPTAQRTSATCEYTSAVDTWAIIGTITVSCTAANIIRAGAYWMSSSGNTNGLFITGDHTEISGLAATDQVQYTITLQFT
jgi:hypothetical protein